MSGVKAFREAFMSSDFLAADDFASYDARRQRYQVLWAFYENTAYSHIHKWAIRYKSEHGLYKYIRSIYNPAHRLGEFWKVHLMGGTLDIEAGDGSMVPSALPIQTDNKDLRRAIAQLWADSNWQVKKDVYTLWGPVMGDVALEVVDRPNRKKTYLRVVHPGTIKSATLDDFGNVKAYEIEEIREDLNGKEYTYGERCENVGGGTIHYETLKDGRTFAYGDGPAEWEEQYGFVPLVLVKHNDVGLPWGWSEMHAGRVKFQEMDDLASKLSDYIRRSVHAPFLYSGVDKPKKKPILSDPDTVTNIPAPVLSTGSGERDDIPALYAPPGASATPLVAGLSIGETAAYIKELLDLIEHDYPELAVDIQNAGGDISGRALRVNQQPATRKVNQRRPNYDDGLVRAHKMAVSIGAMRGYPGYEGFTRGELRERGVGPPDRKP